ncbi:DUF817 domain-containing protein [Paenibacillus alvei]|uniref:DUF817 domain-containing protein n=1 Tax=Paenibacillus alvei TaxID=44250 RepID=UPI002282EF50|nr:DUF817 domain-containing protein [Paenibacillus alvei]
MNNFFKLKSFLNFGWHQAMSCLFPAYIFAMLALTKVIDIPFMHRYDFLLLVCILAQVLMIRFGIETMDECKVICVFHFIGLALEIFKIHMGSWGYPEDGWSKILGVPLYSGFMYASVASYLCQAWRRLQVKVNRYPSAWLTIPLGAAIYFNFMTHHFIYDLRWVLMILLFVIFFRTYVEYTVLGVTRRMPIVLSFVLIGFFIWVAENIGTFLGAWYYPHQTNGWNLVKWGKFSSWFLLVIVSFMIVAHLKHVKGGHFKRNSHTRFNESTFQK